MPNYQVECHECGQVEDRRLSYREYDEVKAGKVLGCNECGKPAQLVFAPGNLGFVLKEGESGGWASKSIKENAYRKKRIGVMDKRKRDHVKPQTLQPNYNGQETGSWREAREAARQDKGEVAASTYDALVSKERVAT